MTEERTGKVQTVEGLMEPGDLGVTLTHEHLLIDLAITRDRPSEASLRQSYYEPVSMKNLAHIRNHSMQNADNSRLMDVDTAIEEAGLYHQFGGDTLVDATSIGIARDPVGLRRISRATGVNVVMGASFYVDPAHPQDMDGRSEDSLTEQIVLDVTDAWTAPVSSRASSGRWAARGRSPPTSTRCCGRRLGRSESPGHRC